MNSPKMLYHYTSIESLALILKNKTIRLNSLDKMDDLQENIARDIDNLGRLIFVSSWTEQEKESIPMWKMYSDIESGVRIALPTNPFVREHTKGKIIKSPSNWWGYYVEDDGSCSDTFLDVQKLNKNGVMPVEAIEGNLLSKVAYTDDKEYLEPQACKDDAITIDVLGIYKSTFWEFQKEWRYMLHFLPTYTGFDDKERARFYKEYLVEMRAGKASLPITHFDLTISDEAFNQMEILKSPKLSAGNEILLETLIEKYNSKAKIIESKLKGYI